MIETNKTQNLLQTYVLELLSPAEKRRVEQQIKANPSLLAQVQQERQVGQLVKQTLQQTGQIENGRLSQLMPAIPKQKRPFWAAVAPRQLAMAAATMSLLFVLLLGGWQWFNHNQPSLWPAQPTTVAVTATMTHTPAATETQTAPTETAVAQQDEPNIVMTPAPLPTPVAAIMINTN